jgi:hypothetical protein
MLIGIKLINQKTLSQNNQPIKAKNSKKGALNNPSKFT